MVAAEPDEDADAEAEEAFTAAPTPPIEPTLFRWVSSSKPDAPALSFSVPVSLLPAPPTTAPLPPPRSNAVCDVQGCSLPRKYKSVKDPRKGGCGMEHLKLVQLAV